MEVRYYSKRKHERSAETWSLKTEGDDASRVEDASAMRFALAERGAANER